MPLTVTSLSHPNTIAKIDTAMRKAITDALTTPPEKILRFAGARVHNAQGEPVLACWYLRNPLRSRLMFTTVNEDKDITELVRKALRKSVKNTR